MPAAAGSGPVRAPAVLYRYSEDDSVAGSTESDNVMRRRVRLLSLLPATRPELCDRLKVAQKTIIRDIEWLQSAGVPLTSEQASPTVPAVWSVPRGFRRRDWLWTFFTADESRG